MAIKENDFLILPELWQLTPLGKLNKKTGKVDSKAPYYSDWTNKDFDRDFIKSEIDTGRAVGIGLRLGKPSGYVVAIDFDGQSAIDLGQELFGELPKTVTWTSGRPGRYQALFIVPEQYRDRVQNKVIKTGVIDDDGKDEQIEFRYTGNQSVLPPSPHPTTDGYNWINSPIDIPVAELPQSAIDYWLTLLEPKVKQQKTKRKQPAKQQQPTTTNTSIPPIPLKICLAKSNQSLLRGVREGGRNQAGTALSRDLIGCANYLNSEGIPFAGDPRKLFDGFIDVCHPPIGLGKDDDPDEPDRIWRSAEGDNPSPACTAEGIDSIIEAWNKKHSPKEEKKTVGDRLLAIAKTATYFHTADKIPYADIWIEGNRHTYAVRSKAFRLWLSGEYLDSTEKGIGSQTLQDTLSTLEAIAIFRGETRQVHLRTAEHQGKIYIDLGTPDWKAIEVDSSGWRLVSDPPVRFWRPDSLLPLPYPVEGGSLEELKELLNVDGSAWILIITFLLFCFCPGKTYPVLVISAHRGSGKTAAAEILKGLIDPGKAALIKLQGDTLKLAVTLSRRWLAVYDNVGHISPEQSDDLCRVATNFGYSTRTLHTTDEETTFELTRPQIITAIAKRCLEQVDALVTRDDLADRVLMVQLPEITEDKRLPQAELNAKVEAARPRILGALLTALSKTLAAIPDTKPETLPRMADYALFAIASEKALGLEDGDFMKVFNQSREQSRQVVIESSPVGEAIVRLMENYPIPQSWKGTASELLKELEKHTDEATYRSRYFPKASNLLSRQLKRLTPDLESVGINLSESRIHGGTRQLVLEKVVKISSPSSPADDQTVDDSLRKDSNGDDNGDDTVTVNSEGDDTFEGDDTVTIENQLSSPTLVNTQQHFYADGDDGDDKKLLFTKADLEKSKTTAILKVGDRVQYVGNDKALQRQYAGILEVCEIKGDRYTCKKPSSSLTSWIELDDLQLVEVTS
jgi:hypothetical protein